jgi:hypothetical protein
VTGLSRPSSCCLSKAQRELLQLPELEGQCVVPWNFPFIPTFDVTPPVNILQASVANGTQMALSMTNSYRVLANRHWDSLMQSTSRLLLITGSCGLQLVNSWTALSAHADQVEILALGPVAIARSCVPTTVVQGSRDYISRLWFSRPEIVVNGVGHMDYWSNRDVKEIAATWLRDRISQS